MSQKISSGAWSLTLARASKPSSASTTWWPPCARKISALRRMVLLSSMTSTLTPVASAVFEGVFIVGRLLGGCARCRRSNLDHLEILLARTALWTSPVHRYVGPGGARGQAMLWIADRFVVDPAADQAHPCSRGFSHESVSITTMRDH